MSIEVIHLNYRSLPKEQQNAAELFTYQGRYYAWQSGRHTGSLYELSRTEYERTSAAPGWRVCPEHRLTATVDALAEAHESLPPLKYHKPWVKVECRSCGRLMVQFGPPFEPDLCASCAVKEGKPKPCLHHFTNPKVGPSTCIRCGAVNPEAVTT